MAIYDINSDQLSQAYDISGTSLDTAYDVEGMEVFGNSYPIDNVVSYYRSEVESVADEINALSSDWTSFVFITDTHNTANENNSQAIINYLLKNTKAKRCFHGGDYCDGDWDSTKYSNWVAPFKQYSRGQFFPAIGNHERFGVPYLSTLVEYIYQDFLANKSYLQGALTSFYYYFDDTSRKTRYLVVNTSESSANGMSTTQLNWITNAVALPGTDWNLVVFGHHDIDASNVTGDWKSTKSAEVTTALSSCNGKIVGYFCGHEHVDQLRLVNNKFYQLISYCDRFENADYFEIDNPSRTRGTTSEHTITVVSFNTSTGEVVTRRIGAGAGSSAHEFSWNYKTLQVS